MRAKHLDPLVLAVVCRCLLSRGKKSLASMSTAKTRMQAEVGRLKREGKWHKAHYT